MKEIVAEAKRHDCTHIAFEDLTQIRERISEGKKFQQWAFRALQEQVAYKADEHGIVVETVDPSYTSQQRSRCVRPKKTATGNVSPACTVRTR